MPGTIITGARSRIMQELKPLLPEPVREVSRKECDMSSLTAIENQVALWLSADRIVLAHGDISPVNFYGRSEWEIFRSMNVNLLSVVKICELVLSRNPKVRILVMGSESASKGSHDTTYWLAKSALHEYVRNRRLDFPGQQLVCVAPSVVNNTGMTKGKDQEKLATMLRQTPKQRGIEPVEVAKLIYFLLFTDEGYITNTVVEMNGGKFARCGI